MKAPRTRRRTPQGHGTWNPPIGESAVSARLRAKGRDDRRRTCEAPPSAQDAAKRRRAFGTARPARRPGREREPRDRKDDAREQRDGKNGDAPDDPGGEAQREYGHERRGAGVMRLDGLRDAEPQRRRRGKRGEAGNAIAQARRQNAAVRRTAGGAPRDRARAEEQAQ